MNCAAFARVLADFLEGNLSPNDRSTVEAHVRRCDSCRKLLEVVEGRVGLLPLESAGELANSIIGRTSGSACPRVVDCLGDFVDGELDQISSQLVGHHLEFCNACRSLADELMALKDELPEFAEIEPGRQFTSAVIGATSARHPFRPRLQTRFMAWFNRMAQRPRFSLEAAYLGTLALALIFVNPVAPLGDVAMKKLASTSMVSTARAAVAQVLPSEWVGSQSPTILKARGYADAVSMKGKNALTSVEYLLTRCGQSSASSLQWQWRTVATWTRQAISAMHTGWSYVSTRFLRKK